MNVPRSYIYDSFSIYSIHTLQLLLEATYNNQSFNFQKVFKFFYFLSDLKRTVSNAEIILPTIGNERRTSICTMHSLRCIGALRNNKRIVGTSLLYTKDK